MKPDILITLPLDESRRKRFDDSYTVHYAPDLESRAATVASVGSKIKAVVTNGRGGISGEHIRAMPDLTIICVVGAGYEAVDVAVARELGIVIGSGAGTNAGSVADHAISLLFASVRNIVAFDRFVHDGGWKGTSTSRPEIFGKNLGLLGLGHIGSRIGERCAGFGMTVGYHTRHRRDDAPHRYFATLKELAQWADFLIACCPGGKETFHIVNAEVLAALGPNGFVVNVGRGSVIDTQALIAALNDSTIAGAALDVVEGEPQVPPGLLEAKNLTITPHAGGASPESREASIDRLLENLEAHFAGKPPIVVV